MLEFRMGMQANLCLSVWFFKVLPISNLILLQVREDCCYVSTQFNTDMRTSRLVADISIFTFAILKYVMGLFLSMNIKISKWTWTSNSRLCHRKRGPENIIARDYVLPDYTNVKRGFLRVRAIYLFLNPLNFLIPIK